MKSIRLVGLAAGVALMAAWTVSAQTSASDLKLDDIIKKSIEAQGGMENIKAIQSMKLTGKMIVGGGQIEAPLVTYMKRPHSHRTEIVIQGQQIIDVYDGKTKWTINPMGGSRDPQRASEEEALAAADDSDIVEGPFVNYKEKGNVLELLGKEDVEGSPAYKIKVTFKSGRSRVVYLDAHSFLPVKEVAHVKQMGQEFDAETKPSNYKKVNGVMIPFSSEMKVNQQVGMEMQFDKVEMNVPVDDSLFAFPEPAAKKPVEPPKGL
ncbi:MAG TPA: hypothetical protein VGL53_15875 [Bryobacteraceae bacterium]|jgi:outer membrane lipoprotein-sorting protein